MFRKYCRAVLAFFRRFRKRKATRMPNAGYAYVPLQVSKVFLKPEDFAVRKGMMTRYGKKQVQTSYYGTFKVLDLGEEK